MLDDAAEEGQEFLVGAPEKRRAVALQILLQMPEAVQGVVREAASRISLPARNRSAGRFMALAFSG